MANRYWVGGSGTWGASSTTNWSTTSGGASGASVPTVADVAIFDQAATYTVAINGPGNRTALALLNTAGTVTFAGGAGLRLGGLTLTATAVWDRTESLYFTIAGTHTIDTKGVTFSSLNITFDSVGTTWTLASDFVGVDNGVTVGSGLLDLNGFTFSTNAIFLYAYGPSYEPVDTELRMNSSTLSTNAFVIEMLPWPSTAVPVITGPGTIELFGGPSYPIYFGWTTYLPPDPADTRIVAFPTVQHTGEGILIIAGASTFESFESSSTAGAVTFTAGTTYTFGAFDVNGAPAALKTLTAQSDGYTEATQATLSKSTPWLVGANSVDAGNNTGLTFANGGGVDYLEISNILAAGVPFSGWVLIDDSQTANWQNVSNAQTPAWGPIDNAQTPGWTPVNT